MRTQVMGLALTLLIGGCLDQRPYGAAGHLCDSDGDCDAQTWCVRQLCAVRPVMTEKPGPDNTGVPRDVTLVSSGGLNLGDDGAVIDGKDIRGCVVVEANNVTIRRSRVRCDSYYAIIVRDGFSGLLVEDVEIDGLGNGDQTGVASEHSTVRRAHIHSLRRGVGLGSNSRVEASYIHGMTPGSSAAVASNGGENSVVTGNTLIGPATTGAAVDMDSALGPLKHVLVEKNWVNGGLYTVRMGGGTGEVLDLKLLGNRFGRDHVNGVWDLRGDVTWSDNVYEDNGEAVDP